MTYIERFMKNNIIKLSKEYPVIMITGPRQVGKTTLLKFTEENLGKKINYVTLDNLGDRTLAQEDPELFLEKYTPPVIIDEFQYAPNLLSYIKIIVDNSRLESLKKGKNSNGLFYLTGSQSFKSIKNISDSLAGRTVICNLYGLSYREIKNTKNEEFIPIITKLKNRKTEIKPIPINKLYETIWKGSYPELHRNKNITVTTYYESYVKTYIERDIRELINVKDELKFMKFLISAAVRTGQELNETEIANDIETTVSTIKSWLSILVNTGIITLIEPYSSNILKRIIKRPKLYFMDTGLACYLAKYNSPETLETSAYSGHIFETYVISEIIKSLVNNGKDPKRYLYYYRDNNQNEIDLIYEYENKIYPIEIKKSKRPTIESIKNFKVLNKLQNKGEGIVLCMINEITPLNKENYLIPIWYI